MTGAPRIALLRGVNVGGRARLPMADLRSLCAEIGWAEVQSYIQSGNLVFRSAAAPDVLESELEAGIERRFGLSVPVLVRLASKWSEHVRGNPFPDASRSEPSRVMLALCKRPPAQDAAERLRERAADGERIERVGDALWIHFPGGAGRSRLSPALLDRAAGSPVTTRNWRTVLRLQEMAGQAGR